MRPQPDVRSPILAALLAFTLAACGSSQGPAGPLDPAPQIACPADLTIPGVASSSQAVGFDPPVPSGGTAPLRTVCTPPPGSVLPLGRTAVACVASDAAGRTASCSFGITLSGFRLGVSRFDAIGDSLTAGEVGRPGLVRSIVDLPNAYPTRLQQSLDAAYPGQGLVVANNGSSGFTVNQTLAILPKLLQTDRPDIVLLLSGFNDLTVPCAPGLASTTACAAARETVGFGIRDCLRRIREANVGVRYTLVSTLTPPGPSGSNRIDATAIVQANQRIRQVVAAEGGVLVDSYARFASHEADYVNADGLHLRPAGYAALADAFYDAIQATVPRTPALRR